MGIRPCLHFSFGSSCNSGYDCPDLQHVPFSVRLHLLQAVESYLHLQHMDLNSPRQEIPGASLGRKIKVLQPKQEPAAPLAQNGDWSCHWTPRARTCWTTKTASASQHQDSQISSGLKKLFLSSSTLRSSPCPGDQPECFKSGHFQCICSYFYCTSKHQLPKGNAVHHLCCVLLAGAYTIMVI